MRQEIAAELDTIELLQSDYDAIDLDLPLYKVGSREIFQDDLTSLLSGNNAGEKETVDLIVKKIIMQDNDHAMKHLSKYGYRISVFNEKGETAIHFAFIFNYEFLTTDKGTLLFSTVDNFNHCDCYKLSYLHIACALGNTIVAEKCLKNNADINAQWNCTFDSYGSDDHTHCDGFTPLHFAVQRYKLDVVKLLLNHGANIEIQDSEGETPLYLASLVEQYEYPSCWENDLEIMEILIKHGSKLDITAAMENFSRLIYGTTDVLNKSEFDVELGIFVNRSIDIDYKERQKEKLELLVKRGADVSQSIGGNTILHYILNNLTTLRFPNEFEEISFDDAKYVDMIRMILSANSNVASFKNKSGESPLSLAVFYMSLDIVKLLLNYTTDFDGIKFELVNSNHSYFHVIPTFECVRNLITIVELLLERGYRLALRDNLNIIKFLTHNSDECTCHASRYDSSMPSIVPRELGTALNFYSSIHVSCLSSVANQAWRSYELQSLQFNFESIEFAKLYIDQDIKIEIIKIMLKFGIPLVKNWHHEKKVKEIELMKSMKLRGDVSLYDVMTKHPNVTYPYIYNYISDDKLFQDFDIYKCMIKGHLSKSITRHYIEESAYDYLQFSSLSLLPYVCRKRVLCYLNNKDMSNFCSAFLSDDADDECTLNMKVDG